MRLRNTTESLKDASLLRVLFYMRMFWQPFTNLIYFSIGRKNILSLLVEIHLWEGIKRRNKWNVHRWTKQIDKVIVTTQWIWDPYVHSMAQSTHPGKQDIHFYMNSQPDIFQDKSFRTGQFHSMWEYKLK